MERRLQYFVYNNFYAGGPLKVPAPAQIVGIGEAEGGKATGRPGVELAADAALRALADAGLELTDVDGLLVEAPDVDQHHMAHLALADVLGMRPRFAYSTGCGGSTPFANVILGAAALAAGMVERILVVDYDSRHSSRSADKTKRLARTRGHRNPWEDPYGPVTAAKFALVAATHMDRYGTTREQLAEITVNARRNGALREGAQLRSPVSVRDVLDSPPIAEPLHLLDCCVVSDWGSAFIMSRAGAGAPRAVDVAGFGQHHEGYALVRATELPACPAVRRSGQDAFAMAGLAPADVDVALIYDSFTITALVGLENLGFCAVGEGGDFVSSGAIAIDGRLPVNPHGGQLSFSGGHGHFITEAVRQLRGEAPSSQVDDASVAVCQGTAAGVMSSSTVLLRRSA
jgi:acetyl-CoA acetyltransferase